LPIGEFIISAGWKLNNGILKISRNHPG